MLFAQFVEALGCVSEEADARLPGNSLGFEFIWPTMKSPSGSFDLSFTNDVHRLSVHLAIVEDFGTVERVNLVADGLMGTDVQCLSELKPLKMALLLIEPIKLTSSTLIYLWDAISEVIINCQLPRSLAHRLTGRNLRLSPLRLVDRLLLLFF
jgi:hypothetical protein